MLSLVVVAAEGEREDLFRTEANMTSKGQHTSGQDVTDERTHTNTLHVNRCAVTKRSVKFD